MSVSCRLMARVTSRLVSRQEISTISRAVIHWEAGIRRVNGYLRGELGAAAGHLSGEGAARLLDGEVGAGHLGEGEGGAGLDSSLLPSRDEGGGFSVLRGLARGSVFTAQNVVECPLTRVPILSWSIRRN